MKYNKISKTLYANIIFNIKCIIMYSNLHYIIIVYKLIILVLLFHFKMKIIFTMGSKFFNIITL